MVAMTCPTETNYPLELERNRIAAARYQLIAPLLATGLPESDRVRLQHEIAAAEDVSYRTLSRYVEKYKEEGFDGLRPGYGGGRQAYAIKKRILDEAILLRREQPGRSVQDIIKIMVLNGTIEEDDVKRSTLQDALSKAGYSKRQMRMYIKPAGGKSATRYQKAHRMDLVQTDIKYGPSIPYGKGGAQPTYFIGFIDDCTRKLLYGRFYTSQSEMEVLQALKCVVASYGVPRSLATDNGKQFTSVHVQAALAVMGIRHMKARPFSPMYKGKIEAYNHRLNKFVDESRLKGFEDIDSLNAAYTAWQWDYNNSPHSALDGETPDNAFGNDRTELRLADPRVIARAFQDTGKRLVQKDATISVDGRKYICDNLNLVGFTVYYSRPADAPDDVTVHCPGFEPCRARPLEIGEDVDFEARNRSLKKGVI